MIIQLIVPKICNKCGKLCSEFVARHNYTKEKEKRTYISRDCAQCIAEYHRVYNLAHRDERRKYTAQWYEENKARVLKDQRDKRSTDPEAVRGRFREWHRTHPEKVVLSDARQRAKKAGVPCTITEDDIVVPEMCPVLGIPLVRGDRTDNSPSLDKIIPKLGYVPGNVMVISLRANRIKNNATPEELMKVANFYAVLAA